jgi:hypothetical protein
MKTSELIKVVEENGFYFTKGMENIYVDTILGWFISIDKENCISINEKRVLRTSKARNVMKAIIEYAETPTSEREEEKKYYVESMIKGSGGSTLRLLKTCDGYFLHEMTYSYFVENDFLYLPKQFQVAIECGFLKKVEVENA